MKLMFRGASAFNQPIGSWRLDSVTSMSYMLCDASAFNQDLGWCVDADVNVDYAFDETRCESTSCGVGTEEFGTCDEGIQAVFIILIVWACLVALFCMSNLPFCDDHKDEETANWHKDTALCQLCCFLIFPPCVMVSSCHKLFCWFWWVSKKDNKREVLREAYEQNGCIQQKPIILILLPFLPFISCIYLFWWLFTKAGESCKVVPAAVDAAPVTSEESSAPATSEEQAVPMGTVEAVHEGEEPAVPMGTVEAVHEGESSVPYATVLSVEQ